MNRNKLLFALGCLSIGLFNTNCSNNGTKKEAPKGAETKKLNVVAYVAGYRNFDFSTIDAVKLTHINYAFVNIREGEVVFDTTKIDGKSLTPKDLDALLSLKKSNPELKILASAGGWTWSKGFSDAALTNESRDKFAVSCARLITQYHLDGIDIDWEYPNQSGAGNTFRPEDIHNFTLMLKAVRENLDKLSAANSGAHYLLTIATGADLDYVKNTELGELQQYVDFINIMTYDFYNGWHKSTGHHSNLNPSVTPELDKNSIVNAVGLHLKAGVPANKLNLGIPFYGRIWEGVKSPERNGLFQEAETIGSGIDYVNFAEKVNKEGFIRYWDETANAPYLWNKEKKTFISYEDEESIRLKIEFLKQKGLAGVMFWEYCADYQHRLQNAVTDNLFVK
jgi:chitinase